MTITEMETTDQEVTATAVEIITTEMVSTHQELTTTELEMTTTDHALPR